MPLISTVATEVFEDFQLTDVSAGVTEKEICCVSPILDIVLFDSITSSVAKSVLLIFAFITSVSFLYNAKESILLLFIWDVAFKITVSCCNKAGISKLTAADVVPSLFKVWTIIDNVSFSLLLLSDFEKTNL